MLHQPSTSRLLFVVVVVVSLLPLISATSYCSGECSGYSCGSGYDCNCNYDNYGGYYYSSCSANSDLVASIVGPAKSRRGIFRCRRQSPSVCGRTKRLGQFGDHVTFARRLTMSGPRLELDAERAITLGLALNELATNAIKYGSLRKSGGKRDFQRTKPGKKS